VWVVSGVHFAQVASEQPLVALAHVAHRGVGRLDAKIGDTREAITGSLPQYPHETDLECRRMAGSEAYKLAFIGTHGVGKTTLCYGLAARLKARDVVLEVVHEVARRCPLPINEQTGVASESWILHSQIAEEAVASARHELVVCDRSALDNYVYLLLASGPIAGLDQLVDHWMASYDLLIFVPIVDRPRADGIRATDPAFQQAVQDRLLRELEARCLPVHRLDPRDRDRWLDLAEARVWEEMRPRQLALGLEPAANG
jgi:nicotinamide riboside kinase